METTMEIKTTYAETPLKQYAYLGDKSKKTDYQKLYQSILKSKLKTHLRRF